MKIAGVNESNHKASRVVLRQELMRPPAGLLAAAATSGSPLALSWAPGLSSRRSASFSAEKPSAALVAADADSDSLMLPRRVVPLLRLPVRILGICAAVLDQGFGVRLNFEGLG